MANKTYLGVPTQHTVKQYPNCKSSDTNFSILKEGTTVEPTIWELSCNNCGYVKSTTDESEFDKIVTDDLSNNVKKIYLGSTDSYKTLDYIESSGTQYIDTGYKPTNNSRVVMEVEALKSGVYPFFGARTANGVDSFVLWEMSSNSIRSDFNTTGTETTVSTVLTRITIDKNKNVCKFGDKTITNGAATFNCSYNLCLLALNSGGEVDERKLSAKLYRCQVYDNDKLIRDFKPCKNSNGILGLYDSINNKFYKNSGTGNFIAGTETGETIEPPSSNSHKVIKGYIGAPSTVPTLGDIPEGQTVKIKENGVLTEFYVAKHKYYGNSVLLARKYLCDEKMYFNQVYNNEYDNSNVDKWLNETYSSKFSSNVQRRILSSAIKYTKQDSMKVGTLIRKIFLLSATELGSLNTFHNIEGTKLPIASTLALGKTYNGSSTIGRSQLTRSLELNSTTDVVYFTISGGAGTIQSGSSKLYVRPCFCVNPTLGVYNGEITGNIPQYDGSVAHLFYVAPPTTYRWKKYSVANVQSYTWDRYSISYNYSLVHYADSKSVNIRGTDMNKSGKIYKTASVNALGNISYGGLVRITQDNYLDLRRYYDSDTQRRLGYVSKDNGWNTNWEGTNNIIVQYSAGDVDVRKDEVKTASGIVTSTNSAAYPNGGYVGGYYYDNRTSETIQQQGTYIEDVESSNPSAYPDNGVGTDGYWYVKQS